MSSSRAKHEITDGGRGDDFPSVMKANKSINSPTSAGSASSYRLALTAGPLVLIVFFILFITPASLSSTSVMTLQQSPLLHYSPSLSSSASSAGDGDAPPHQSVEEVYNNPKSFIYAEANGGEGGRRDHQYRPHRRLPPRPLGNQTDVLKAMARLLPRWEKERFLGRDIPVMNMRDFRMDVPGEPYDWNEQPSVLFSRRRGEGPNGAVRRSENSSSTAAETTRGEVGDDPLPEVRDGDNILATFSSPESEEVKCLPRERTNCANGPLKPSWRRPPASLSVTSYDDYRNIRIRFGILTVAKHVETRLFPLLNTSLKDAEFIDIFIRKTPVSHAVAAYIRAVVKTFHPFANTVRVVELYGPNNTEYKTVATRNAWINLEAMRFWHAELTREHAANVHDSDLRHRPHWYTVVDDDGYIFVENAKAYLFDLEKHVLKRKNPELFAKMEAEVASRRAELIAFRNKLRSSRKAKSNGGGGGGSEVEANNDNYNNMLPNSSLLRSDEDAAEEAFVNSQYPRMLSPEFRQQFEGLDHSLGAHVGPLLTGNVFGYILRVREPKEAKANKEKKNNNEGKEESKLRNSSSLSSNSNNSNHTSNNETADDGLPYKVVMEARGVFANGGPGYYFNRAALEIAGPHYEECFNKYRFDRSGDIIISQCMIDYGTEIHGRNNLCNEAFGVCLARQCHVTSPYPVASHRNIGYKELHKARALYEARRARGELVHWEDIVKHYPPDHGER